MHELTRSVHVCRSSYPNTHIIKFSDDTAILALLKKRLIYLTTFWKSRLLLVGVTISIWFWMSTRLKKRCLILVGWRTTGLWSSTTRPFARHSPLSTSVSLLTTHSPGAHMLTAFAVVYNNGCTFYAAWEFMVWIENLCWFFYKAVLESLIRYSIAAWFGKLSAQLRNKLARLLLAAGKIMGVKKHFSSMNIYEQAILQKANQMINDASHILHSEFEMLPSGRRFRSRLCRLNRLRNSFIPRAISAANNVR